MKIMIFGATGMIGQGVLRECLASLDVESIYTVGRTPAPQKNTKLTQIVVPTLFDLSSVKDHLYGFDACFFCLGVSSTGMSEEEYNRITYKLTLFVAGMLAQQNPKMVFVYVSGKGTDSSGQGTTMWARVKGKTENNLMQLPFAGVGLFRLGSIISANGEKSKTRSYRLLYTFITPILKVLRCIVPNSFLTTEEVGRAMLNYSKLRTERRTLEVYDIALLSRNF